MKHERNTEDAILSRLMAELSEEEGARLWQEYQDAEAQGKVPPVTDELDRRCLRLIHREFSRQYTKALGKPLLKLAGRAAAAVIAGAWLDGGAEADTAFSEDLLAALEQDKDIP